MASALWGLYCAFWSVLSLIMLETAGFTTMGFVFKRTLAGFRPTPSYRRLVACFAVSSS